MVGNNVAVLLDCIHPFVHTHHAVSDGHAASNGVLLIDVNTYTLLKALAHIQGNDTIDKLFA